MITVAILINGKPIFARSAVNVSKPSLSDVSIHTYKTDTGDIIKHRRTNGAVQLAIKMLKTIKEL